ncbi:MAG: sulfurtransferase TusA family protein, partial [Myxococcota bacterium]
RFLFFRNPATSPNLSTLSGAFATQPTSTSQKSYEIFPPYSISSADSPIFHLSVSSSRNAMPPPQSSHTVSNAPLFPQTLPSAHSHTSSSSSVVSSHKNAFTDAIHLNTEGASPPALSSHTSKNAAHSTSSASLDAEILDCRGLKCPLPITRIAKAVRHMRGETLQVLADDDAFPADVKAWAEFSDVDIVHIQRQGSHYNALLQKRKAPIQTLSAEISSLQRPPSSHNLQHPGLPIDNDASEGLYLEEANTPVHILYNHESAQSTSSNFASNIMSKPSPPLSKNTSGSIEQHFFDLETGLGLQQSPSIISAKMGPQNAGDMSVTNALQLDYCGLQCPMPIVRLSQAVRKNKRHEIFEVKADDPAFATDIRAWCASTNVPMKVEHVRTQGRVHTALLRREASTTQTQRGEQ